MKTRAEIAEEEVHKCKLPMRQDYPSCYEGSLLPADYEPEPEYHDYVSRLVYGFELLKGEDNVKDDSEEGEPEVWSY